MGNIDYISKEHLKAENLLLVKRRLEFKCSSLLNFRSALKLIETLYL